MKKALLIAEKPSYKRDIESCYDKHSSEIDYDIDFVNQIGHAVTLMDPVEMNPIYKSWDVSYLPILPDEEGGWKYKVIKETKDVFDNIKKHIQSGKYDVIIHAGDPDQEGELLTRLVLKFCKNKLPVIRLWPNATTEVEILKALKNMKPDTDEMYENMYHAALVRQHADWLFGMNGSRAVASRIKTNRDNKIAVGRVMTGVLAMIVHREDEIDNFKPKTNYGVESYFSNGLRGSLYEEEKNENENKKQDETDESKKEDESKGIVLLDTIEEAQNIINDLTDKAVVVNVTERKTKQMPPPLYNLSTAQADAGKLGFTPDQTLDLIQSLYEKHFVTYPRTDCSYLSSSEDFAGMLYAITSIPEFADKAKQAESSVERIRGIKKYVNDKELQKHGHSALCPTTSKPKFSELTENEQKIYYMICKRFLAIFEPPLEQTKITILTKNNEFLFKSTGKVVTQKGYADFLGMDVQDNAIPSVSEGDVLDVSKNEISEHTTTCPKRFNTSTIIQAMENPAKYLSDKELKNKVNFVIGTVATRAEIIKKLMKDKYITQKKNGTYYSTEWGRFLIHTLNDIDITKIDMTGKWEIILSQLRNGELSIEQGEDLMKREVKKMVTDIEQMKEYQFGDITVNTAIIGKCPVCGSDLIQTEKNYFCSGYKNGCKVSVPRKFLGAEFSTEDALNLINGKNVNKKLKKDDKTWMQELGFDKEKGSLTFINKEGETDWDCPVKGCTEKLKWNGNKLQCSCGYQLYTTVAKKQLSDKELDYIFKHGHSNGKLKGFVSSKGKKFEAKLKLKTDGTGGFDFDFK